MKGQFFPFGDSMKTRRMPIITYSLVVINVFVFALSMGDLENIIYAFGFIPAVFPSVTATILTSIFLHGGIDHLFGNMWYLWIFGDNVEDKIGRIKFAGLYLASGIAASLVQYVTDPHSTIPAVGASGAISGVLGWYYVAFPKARITTSTGYLANESPAWMVIGFWFLIQLFFGAATLVGFSGSNVAFFAHIGGFVCGYLAAKLAKKSR